MFFKGTKPSGSAGGGGGVQSVSGDGVDNTNPSNPTISQTPTESSILVTNGNSEVTTVTNNPGSFVNANVDNLAGVASIYEGNFSQNATGEAALKYSGDEEDYELSISGTVTSINPAFLGTFVIVKLVGDIQGEFTGGRKPYPVGVSLGGSEEVGFGITIYGKFPPNEVIRVQLSSSNAGDLILSDCIYFAQKIRPFT